MKLQHERSTWQPKNGQLMSEHTDNRLFWFPYVHFSLPASFHNPQCFFHFPLFNFSFLSFFEWKVWHADCRILMVRNLAHLMFSIYQSTEKYVTSHKSSEHNLFIIMIIIHQFARTESRRVHAFKLGHLFVWLGLPQHIHNCAAITTMSV